MSYTGNQDHTITLTEAAILTRNYRLNTRNTILGERFSKTALQSVLNQVGCLGVKIYYAQSNEGVPKMVIVGVDSAGNDMIAGKILEFGEQDPPYASVPNALTY